MSIIPFFLCLGLLIPGGVLSAPTPAIKFLQSMDAKYNNLTIKVVRLDKDADLDCDTNKQTAIVTLWHRRIPRGYYTQVLEKAGKVVKKGSGEFTISKFTVEDSGYYQCRARSKQTNQEIHRNFVVIINNAVPSLVMKPETLLEKKLAGSHVTLSCETTPADNRIRWFYYQLPQHQASRTRIRNSMKFQIRHVVVHVSSSYNNVTVHKSILTIPSAQVADSGHYECRVTHPDYNLYKNNHLVVMAPQAPTFTVWSYTISPKAKTKSFLLECKPDGYPTPNIEWQFNGKRLTPCTRIHKHYCSDTDYIKTDNGMRVEPVKPDNMQRHTGLFTCIATNSYGTARKYFDVNVQVAPEIDDSRKHFREPAGNTTFTVKFKTLGYPEPTITWEIQPWYNGVKYDPLLFSPFSSIPVDARPKVIRPPTKANPTTEIFMPDKLSLGAYFRVTATNDQGSDNLVIFVYRI